MMIILFLTLYCSRFRVRLLVSGTGGDGDRGEERRGGAKKGSLLVIVTNQPISDRRFALCVPRVGFIEVVLSPSPDFVIENTYQLTFGGGSNMKCVCKRRIGSGQVRLDAEEAGVKR